MIMTQQDEEELLRLTKENNYMLKHIIAYLRKDNNIDFINNILANLIANKFERNKC